MTAILPAIAPPLTSAVQASLLGAVPSSASTQLPVVLNVGGPKFARPRRYVDASGPPELTNILATPVSTNGACAVVHGPVNTTLFGLMADAARSAFVITSHCLLVVLSCISRSNTVGYAGEPGSTPVEPRLDV